MKAIKITLWFWVLSGLLFFGCRTQHFLLEGVINYDYGSSAENFTTFDLDELYEKVNVFLVNRGWKVEQNTVDPDINELTALFSRSMFEKVNFEVAVRLHRRGWDIKVNFIRTQHSDESLSQREVDKYCENVIKDVDLILKREVTSKWQRSHQDILTNGESNVGSKR